MRIFNSAGSVRSNKRFQPLSQCSYCNFMNVSHIFVAVREMRKRQFLLVIKFQLYHKCSTHFSTTAFLCCRVIEKRNPSATLPNLNVSTYHAAFTLGIVLKFLCARRGVSVIASEEQIDLKNIVIQKRERAFSSADKKEIRARLIKVAEFKNVVQYVDGI